MKLILVFKNYFKKYTIFLSNKTKFIVLRFKIIKSKIEYKSYIVLHNFFRFVEKYNTIHDIISVCEKNKFYHQKIHINKVIRNLIPIFDHLKINFF